MSAAPVTGLVASSPAAWASSGRHIVVPFGRVLRVFDVASSTPRCIASLRGHSAAVVSVTAAGNMRVASASEDGTVRVWDVSDGSCMRTIDVGQEISAMCEAGPEKLLCVGTRCVLLLSLSKQEKSRIRTLFSSQSLASGYARVASPANGTFVAIAHTNVLHIRSIAKGEEGRSALLKHISWLTSVAVSSDGSMLAVGDESGAIFVYPNPSLILPRTKTSIRLEPSKTVCSKLHWHSSPVRGLSFSQDGNLLVSGGTEAVLVTWKMTRNHFGTRNFLPRLKSSILAISISDDESTYAITQADNSVRLIDQASNTISSTIRGIGADILEFEPFVHRGSLSSKISPACKDAIRMVRDPRHTGQVLISGSGGEVQRFDLCKGQHVSDITIIPHNTINEPKKHRNHAKCPDPAQVTEVKVSPSGEHMATTDRQSLSTCNVGDFDIEGTVTTLRFWKINPNGETPALEAVFSQPHGVGVEVSSICFHPQIPVVATTSAVGKFKLWREVNGVKQGREVVWRNEVELGYKGLSCTSACFSNDGSLLAVACGSVLTLWHIEDLVASATTEKEEGANDESRPQLDSPSSLRVELLHALVHPPAEEAIQSVSFMHNRLPLCVAITEAGIYVWNALTQGIWWSSRIRTIPRTMATDEEYGQFALAVKIPSLIPTADDSHLDMEDSIQEATTENGAQSEAEGLQHGTLNPNDGSTGKSSQGRRKSSKGGEKIAKRVRSKRKHQTMRQSEPKSGHRPKRTCPMDSAIAFFDATSPYPLRISRLPTGVDVTSLEFIRNSRKGKGAQRTLACIDSKLEVSFYGATGDEGDQLSLLTNPTSPDTKIELTPSKHVDKLDSLLGNSRDGHSNVGVSSQMYGMPPRELRVPNSTSEVSTEETEEDPSQASVMRAFGDCFDGPIHVQAPVSSKSVDFINAILRQGKHATASTRAKSTTQDWSSQDTPMKAENVGISGKSLELLAEEYKARWDFCGELVRAHDTKASKNRADKR